MFMMPADKNPKSSAVLLLNIGTIKTEAAFAMGSIIDMRSSVKVLV